MSEPRPDQGPVGPKEPVARGSRSAGPAAKSFWAGFPGIMTAVGGFVAAIATLLTALYQLNWLHPATPAPAPTAVVIQTPLPAPSEGPTLTLAPTVVAQAASPTPESPTPTSAPSAVTQATSPSPEGLVLADDFSDPGSGWTVGGKEGRRLGYRDGEYRIIVVLPQRLALAMPKEEHDLANLVIEVDARRIVGPVKNLYGVVARRHLEQDFYAFVVSSEGQFSVRISRKNSTSTLVDWTSSDAIRVGGDTNRLRVECQGARMRFYANDKLLTEIEDSTFRSGGVALLAGTADAGGVEVGFDNLAVRTLSKP